MFPLWIIAANVSTHLPDYTMSHLTRQQYSQSSPSEPEVSSSESVLLIITKAVICKISLMPWDRVLPAKLIAPQVVQIFFTFYGTPSLTTVFTAACHLFLSWARWIQSMPSHPTSLNIILIYTLGLSSCFFLKLISQNPVCNSLLPRVIHAKPISSSLIWSPD
jgi:hypothetical protein